MKYLLWLPLLSLALSAEESCRVFLAENAPEAPVRQALQALLSPEQAAACEFIRLSPACNTPEQAQAHALAIESGVFALPSLVLADAQGTFATLPLRGLTPDQLAAARQHKDDAARRQEAQQQHFTAQLYRICALVAHTQADDAALAARIAECRALLGHPQSTPHHAQFIGLRLLYPLLLEQYRRGYAQGVAHTPATEAKLLEAIAALETARDINPDSPLGKHAFAERERLRAARRKARQYE